MSENPASTPDQSEPAKQPIPSTAPPPKGGVWHKIAAQIMTILVVLGTAVVVLWVWQINEHHPRTDDATVRANVVGIAPRVFGQISKLNIVDNQGVNKGDVLFEIDPEDYELTLQKAKADLATLDQEIKVARARDAELKFQVKAAEAAVEGATSQFAQASNTLQRLEPLLPKGYTTPETVDKARTAEKIAAAAVAEAQQRLNTARTALSSLAALEAQREGTAAAVRLAELHLSYCKVVAPFSGRVINLNISAGAHAASGVPVFSLLDTNKWYVIAEFREGELRHISAGAPVDVYLMSDPERLFKGKVQSAGWAVEPTGEFDVPHGLPVVQRQLDWVHIAQRFPVRIEVENPDPNVFRMGVSAVAIIK